MDQQDQQARTAEEVSTPPKPELSMSLTQSIPNIKTNPNLIAILAYLSILVFIPYFTASNNPFVRFHVNQGITLLIFEIILYAISAIFGFMMGGFLYVVINFLQLFLFVLAIIGVINVVKNKIDPLPFIGHINILSL